MGRKVFGLDTVGKHLDAFGFVSKIFLSSLNNLICSDTCSVLNVSIKCVSVLCWCFIVSQYNNSLLVPQKNTNIV